MYLKKIITGLGMIVFMTSCENDLIESPVAVLGPETFYKDFAQFNTALNGAYALTSTSEAWGGEGIHYLFNSGTDECYPRDNNRDTSLASIYESTPDTPGDYQSVYERFYQAIGATNFIIDAVYKNGASLSQDEYDKVLGQALFFRAYCHLQLSQVYGAVIIANKALMPTNIERSSIEDVFTNLIIKDMLEAIELLPSGEFESNHPYKEIAEAFLAKTYNYLATAKVQGMGEELWAGFPKYSFAWVDAADYHTKALALTTSLIPYFEGIKTLAPEYDNLFRFTNDAQRQEFLWTAPATELGGQLDHRFLGWGLPQGKRNFGGGQARLRATHHTYYKYDATDIRRDHNIVRRQDPKIVETTVNGLPYYGVTPFSTNVNHFNSIGKFRSVDETLTNLPNGSTLIPVSYMRMAELYFMHAEALFFKGREADARTALYPIRLRAAGYDTTVADALMTAYNKADFIEEYLDEKSREFYMEGVRRLDLYRFGTDIYETTIKSVDPSFNNNTAQNYPYITDGFNAAYAQNRHLWGPISTKEIGVNNLIDQSPGFGGE